MFYYVGKYNIDIINDVYYDGNKKYRMVIISSFKDNLEVDRKTFYFRIRRGKNVRFGVPNLKNEDLVDMLFTFKNNERFIFDDEEDYWDDEEY